MTTRDLVSLLGLTLGDDRVEALLTDFSITRRPRPPRGDVTTDATNRQLGVDLTFRNEASLKVRLREYEEGACVLSALHLHGGDRPYKPFTGALPHGLSFGMTAEAVEAALGKKPDWQNDTAQSVRWDFPDHCLFASYRDNVLRRLTLQLPVVPRAA